MTAIEFLQRFEEFLGRNGWPTGQSPWTIVEQWESLVDQAAGGYQWGYYEFTNELGVRDLLGKAFEDDTLQGYDQLAAMRERVEDADARLRALLLADAMFGGEGKPWWRRGVLATAGDDYVDDVKRLFGIDLRHRFGTAE